MRLIAQASLESQRRKVFDGLIFQTSTERRPNLTQSIIEMASDAAQAKGEIGEEQIQLFRQAMEEARKQIEKIDVEMQEEIARTREKLTQLQSTKKRYLSIFQDAADILGVSSKEK